MTWFDRAERVLPLVSHVAQWAGPRENRTRGNA